MWPCEDVEGESASGSGDVRTDQTSGSAARQRQTRQDMASIVQRHVSAGRHGIVTYLADDISPSLRACLVDDEW